VRRSINRSRLMLRVALAVLPAIVACGGDSGTGPSSVAGQYSLQTINGAALPFLEFQQGTIKIELLSDVLTVTGTGTWSDLQTERTTIDTQVSTDTTTDSGTYTLSESTVTFTANGETATQTGTLSNGTLTVSGSGFTLIYRKQ
jgi:hypothetical protein